MSRGTEALPFRAESSHANEVGVSVVTFWEVALLSSKGRIAINRHPAVWRSDVLDLGIREFVLNGDIAIRSALLVDAHRDPADRFIMATAQFHQATLVTADHKILDWSGALSRLDVRL